MNRNDLIMWFSRIATIIFTIAVVLDMYANRELSYGIRATVLTVVVCVFATLFAWQIHVAHKYDGLPVIPLSFRWVMSAWLGSLTLLVAWVVLISFFDGMYSDLRSAVIWWQAGVSTTWFMARWITVQTPHQAGVGETGSSVTGNGNGGGS